MLAFTFSLERSHQYIYGVDVIVENDHKALESILHWFNLHPDYKGFYFVYRSIISSSSTLIIADTLSRAHLPYMENQKEEIDDEI